MSHVESLPMLSVVGPGEGFAQYSWGAEARDCSAEVVTVFRDTIEGDAGYRSMSKRQQGK